MNNFSIKEIGLTLGLLIVAIVFVNPFGIFMTSMMQMILLGVIFIAVALFIGALFNEHAHDEREGEHRNSAARVGYLLGLSTLLVGIAVQTFGHRGVDGWLVSALVAMVVGKVCARIYNRLYR